MSENLTKHPGWLLALDSSTDQAGICLTNGHQSAELAWDARRDQTTTLLAAADHLLELQRLALSDLAAIAVATGPGAFTSLRVGLSTAKGLAYACNLPLIGVPTLDGAARPFAESSRDHIAVIAAGRGRLAWATYGARDGLWRQLEPPRNGVVDELASAVQQANSSPLISGELDPHQRQVLQDAGCQITTSALSGRRPAGVATLAWQRLERGDVDDVASLTPIYLHGGASGA